LLECLGGMKCTTRVKKNGRDVARSFRVETDSVRLDYRALGEERKEKLGGNSVELKGNARCNLGKASAQGKKQNTLEPSQGERALSSRRALSDRGYGGRGNGNLRI